MKLYTNKIYNFLYTKGWSEGRFAQELGLDYSYIYRLLRGQRRFGQKFISQFSKLCLKENIQLSDYIDFTDYSTYELIE